MKYIDADELKLKVNHEMDMQDTYLPAHFFDIVDDMPAADVQEVRHGRWILGGEIGWPKWTCSVCGCDGRGDYKICPWCGAKMEGKQNG